MVAGGVVYSHDVGLQRSLYFWRRAFPVYLHYRYVQIRTKNAPTHVRDLAFDELHNRYAPTIFDIIYHLKGFFIKLAQVGSTRADFLPPQYLDQCQLLQDQAPGISFEEVQDIIRTSLGLEHVSDVFSQLDATPLGVASIGQAHKARLCGGTCLSRVLNILNIFNQTSIFSLDESEVVVKVQLPDAEDQFRADIRTIRQFCELAQPQHAPFLSEVEKQFMNEFDYRREAQNLADIRTNIMEHSPFGDKVILPKPYLEKCTKEVMVMEYIPGKKLLDAIQDHFKTVARERGFESVEALTEWQACEDAQREAMGEEKRLGMSSWEMKSMKFWMAIKHAIVHLVFPSMPDHSNQLLDIPALLDTMLQVHGWQIFVNGQFNVRVCVLFTTL